MLYSQFFANPSEARTRSVASTSSSAAFHSTFADARLKGLIADLKKKLFEGVSLPAQIGIDGVQAEDEEERKRIWREQEHERLELQDRIKDLEVEVTCARTREVESQKVAEELARQQALRE